jgi:hypothetical protein
MHVTSTQRLNGSLEAAAGYHVVGSGNLNVMFGKLC